MSITRRLRRAEERNKQKLMNIIHEKFKKQIEGKTKEEILDILEDIRIKYNIDALRPQQDEQHNQD